MADRELLVRILGDDRDLQRALGNTDRRLKQIDGRMSSFGRGLKAGLVTATATLGTAAIFKGLSDAVDAASALNEEVAKSQQVFGDASSAVEEFSKRTADSLGIAQREALTATGTFGNLFATVGLGQDAAAQMSTQLVQLAADLGSFNNADISDVLAAIRSGLIGEAEPLRRYGVLLSEARVQQAALAATGKENVKALTDQEKALARFNIIMQDTALAQGDFARTSSGLANQTKILRAQFANLQAELGTKLLPVMVRVVSTANEIFDLFSQGGDTLDPRLGRTLADVDVSGLIDMRDRLREVKGAGDDVVQILNEIIAKTIEFQQGGPRRPALGPGAGIGLDIRRREVEEIEKAAAAERASILEADRSVRRSRAAFASFIRGQELKLDRAALTESLDDDLAVLRAIEAAIERRIQVEGRTFKLVSQLTAVRRQIASTVEDQAALAEQAGEDAFNATVDALTLDLDIARSTKSLADDQAALRALEQAILRRIESEGRTTDLMRQLFNVRQEQRDVAQQLADQQREARQRRREALQGRQFEALGLTSEGQERAPSQQSLRRRGESLEERIRGTALDTKRNRQILEDAARVLSGQFGKVGREVRLAIEGMFEEIAAGLESGDRQMGPLTRTAGLNTKKILAGLGLSPEEINALRGRLSGFNTAGQELAGLGTPGPRRTATAGFGGIQGAILVESHTTINLDGQQVARVVTKQQQKTRRRNPQQKRGPNRNR